MKGCLSTIITILILTFLGIYALSAFDKDIETILTSVNLDEDTIVELLSSTNIDEQSLIQFLKDNNILEPSEPYPTPTTFKPGLSLTDTSFPKEPRTEEDFRKVFLYMANENILEITLDYPESYQFNFEDSNIIQNNCSTAFDAVVVEFVDLFSGISKADYKMSGNSLSSSMTIRLSSYYVTNEELIAQQLYFEEYAKLINTQLHEKGMLSYTMTQYEIARVLFTYVTHNLYYDESISYESYTGYGAVKNKTAVCQGYTALYNYLLKLNDIYAKGQSGYIIVDNTPHIWTVSLLDGDVSYADVTFADPTPDQKNYTDYHYFNVSTNYLNSTRTGVE